MNEQLPIISKHTHTSTDYRDTCFFQKVFQKTAIQGSDINKIMAMV